jgi:hypothetical protein
LYLKARQPIWLKIITYKSREVKQAFLDIQNRESSITMDFNVIPYFKVQFSYIIFQIEIIKKNFTIANRNHIMLINVNSQYY